MYYVYVLKSDKDRNLYVGCTSDIVKRLKAHQSGLVRSTKARLPVRLILQESFADRYEAYRAERSYKSAVGKRLLKKKIEKYCQIV